tara:strand:- start:10 stop:462 length:453 start_codon:yes stop_codon:yes gene_type:complete
MKKTSKLKKIRQLLKKHPEKNNKEIGLMANSNSNYVAKIRRNEKQPVFKNEARVIINKPRPKNRGWFLDEARVLINGPRANDYGESQINHDRIAKMWTIICKTEITPEQVIACMIAVKLARLSEDITKSDSWVDIIGYAALGGEMVNVKS